MTVHHRCLRRLARTSQVPLHLQPHRPQLRHRRQHRRPARPWRARRTRVWLPLRHATTTRTLRRSALPRIRPNGRTSSPPCPVTYLRSATRNCRPPQIVGGLRRSLETALPSTRSTRWPKHGFANGKQRDLKSDPATDSSADTRAATGITARPSPFRAYMSILVRAWLP